MSSKISIEPTNREEILIRVPLSQITENLGGTGDKGADLYQYQNEETGPYLYLGRSHRAVLLAAIEETKRLSKGPEEVE